MVDGILFQLFYDTANPNDKSIKYYIRDYLSTVDYAPTVNQKSYDISCLIPQSRSYGCTPITQIYNRIRNLKVNVGPKQ